MVRSFHRSTCTLEMILGFSAVDQFFTVDPRILTRFSCAQALFVPLTLHFVDMYTWVPLILDIMGMYNRAFVDHELWGLVQGCISQLPYWEPCRKRGISVSGFCAFFSALIVDFCFSVSVLRGCIFSPCHKFDFASKMYCSFYFGGTQKRGSSEPAWV